MAIETFEEEFPSLMLHSDPQQPGIRRLVAHDTDWDDVTGSLLELPSGTTGLVNAAGRHNEERGHTLLATVMKKGSLRWVNISISMPGVDGPHRMVFDRIALEPGGEPLRVNTEICDADPDSSVSMEYLVDLHRQSLEASRNVCLTPDALSLQGLRRLYVGVVNQAQRSTHRPYFIED